MATRTSVSAGRFALATILIVWSLVMATMADVASETALAKEGFDKVGVVAERDETIAVSTIEALTTTTPSKLATDARTRKPTGTTGVKMTTNIIMTMTEKTTIERAGRLLFVRNITISPMNTTSTTSLPTSSLPRLTSSKTVASTTIKAPPKPTESSKLFNLPARTAKPGTCEMSSALPVDPSVTYLKGEVWRENGTDWFCPCNIKPCLWMCCPKGQTFNSSIKCVYDTFFSYDRDSVRQAPLSEFYLRYDAICPGKKLRLEPEEYPEDNYTLFENGTLSIPGFNPNFFVPGEFCFSYVENNVSKPVVMVCVNNEEHDVQTALVMYSCFMILSLPFLAATFLVYALIPKLQNLHGKIVMSHVFVLFTAYLNLVIVQLKSQSFPNWACEFTAFIIYFAFLASFFWLNVMCLDIWWTFSGFRPMRGSVKEREHKKFIIYSLYCWGSPLIMLIIALIMDLHPGIPETYEKPGFGEKKCWFRSNMGNFIYFSGPIAILIVCNIVLFILTAFKIRQVKRGTKILKKQDSRRHNEEEENNAQRFNLYLKLFLVMGVNWIMEVISFAAGGPDEWWYVTDLANTLQGVLIFVIFVWKDRIRRLLMERFCPGRVANMNSTVNSSSTRMTGIRRNGSVMSSNRSSLKTQEGHQMKALAASHSVRSDDSDVA